MATPRKRPSAGYEAKPADLAVLELDQTLPVSKPKPNGSATPAYRGVSTGLLPADDRYLRSSRLEKQAEYGEQDQQIDEMRRVRTLTDIVALPVEAQFVDIQVREPIIADEIQRVVATLTLNRPKLAVKAARPGETAEKNATLREEATEEILWQAATRITGRNTFREVADYTAGDGGGWTKFLFTKDTWEARYALRRAQFDNDETEFLNAVDDQKKAAGVPFVWQAVDVRNVYPTWSMGKLTEVLEISKRPIHQALRQYRLGVDKQGHICPEAVGLPINEVDATKLPHTVTFYEHWDAEYCTYLIEGSYGDAEVVKQFKHRMGRVPYFYSPGYSFPWQTNNKVGWGIAQSKVWLVQYLAFLESLHAQQAARDTFAPFYRILDATKPGVMGKNGKPIASEKYKLGQITNGPPGSSLQAFPFPQTSGALNEQIHNVKEAINRLLTPRITSEIGGGPGGLEGAGFAINQVLSESRIYLDPLAQSIAAMLVEVTKFMWHLIRTRVKETVWVEQSSDGAGWLGLGPDDLVSGVGVRWELDPERPSAKLIEERYWHERMKAGTASTFMAIEAMGDNPDEVRFQRDMEAIRAEPWYIQWRQSYILKELGRGDILAKAAAAAASTGELPGIPGSNASQLALPPPPGATPPGPPQIGVGAQPGGPPGMPPPTSGPQPVGAGSMGLGTPPASMMGGAQLRAA